MRGYCKGGLLRIAVFFTVFLIIFFGVRLAGVQDETRLRNENERRRILLAKEEFLLQMMDEMERGAEKDWLNEAMKHGMRRYVSVRWNEKYRGVYLIEHQGFPSTVGFRITREHADKVHDPGSTRIEVYDRGKGIFVYRLSHYWD